MVCLGNICRSPLAEGILAHKVKENGLDWEIDSAGTAAYHVGNLPDERSIEVANKYGIDLTNQRARQFKANDFKEFDVIYAMDTENYNNILNLAKYETEEQKVKLILNEIEPDSNSSVPDPYYGGEEGFENVYQMLDLACEEVLNKFK
jgi:protein-tyrosine phosphatase|tara:strand:- start:17 stop:460 length:444 start_codon:yes stop_codon:yes gene_type:complete